MRKLIKKILREAKQYHGDYDSESCPFFNQYVSRELFEKIKKKFNAVEELGNGQCGHAFLTSDKKVMKLTCFEREVNVTKQLVGKKLDHVADVYVIYKFKTDKDDYWMARPDNNFCYIILSEYITPLSEEDETLCDIFHNNGKWNIPTADNYKYHKDERIRNLYAEYIEMAKSISHEVGEHIQDIGGRNIGRKQNGNLAAFDYLGTNQNTPHELDDVEIDQ